MSWDFGDNNGAVAGDSEWNDGGGNANFDDTGNFGGDTNHGADSFGDAGGVGGGDGDGGGGDFACFNCGETGHNKANCINPAVSREFTGECRVCNQPGHMAKDCPERPPQVCRNCAEEGHMAVDCKNPRQVDRSHIKDVDSSVAWNNIKTAVEENDLDDVKESVQQYIKACPETTYESLEKSFRRQGVELYLIAIEKPNKASVLTNMDFQGRLNRKYTVTYRFSDKPARPREIEFWPKSPEENMERLADAGELVDSELPKCRNCDEVGHISKSCPQDKREPEGLTVQCYNCGNEGHRMRDCTEARIDKFACKNCNKSGHKVSDCPEPRVAGPDVECRKCGENGHFSRDCPQGGGGDSRGCFNCGEEGHSKNDCPNPRKIICRNCDGEGHTSRECPEPRNMAKMQCRNCDEFGHGAKDCPKPRDMARVKCSNCGEMGHFKSRCTNETAPLDGFDAPIGVEAPVDMNAGMDGITSGGW